MPAQATSSMFQMLGQATLNSDRALQQEAARPTLHVVGVPETEANVLDSPERDRQASLDLLHRLVMGPDQVQ